MRPVSPVLPGYDVAEVVFAKDQPEYMQLPAVRVESPEAPVLTRWELSDEDRKKIAAGADIYLWVTTFGRALQPVALQVATASEIMDPVQSKADDQILDADVIGDK
jgi:hypothetical protein